MTSCAADVMRAWPHVRRMLQRRGYQVHDVPARIDYQYLAGPLAAAQFRYVCALDTSRAQAHAQPARLAVVYHLEPKIGVKYVRAVMEQLETHAGGAVHAAVLLSPEGATAFTNKEVHDQYSGGGSSDASGGGSVQIFRLDEFFFSLADHALVRAHRIATRREQRLLLEHLMCTAEKLPVLLRDDPLARYYNLPAGALVCFARQNGTQERSVYYRLVH